jgi:subtilisin-like proprotein convertase family protein
MLFSNWFQSWKRRVAPSSRYERRRKTATTRLFLERLEDRTVPSTGWTATTGGAIQPGGTGSFGTLNTLARDSSGDFYVTGYFSGTVTFQTPNTPNGITNLTATSNNTGYLARVDHTTGNFVWAVQFGGLDSSWSGVTVDTNGNVYVTGDFSGTQNFGSTPLMGNGTNATGFLCQVDSATGHINWAKEFSYGTDVTHSGRYSPIAVDASGNVYLAWWATPSSGNVAFLSKYDPSGNPLWNQPEQLDSGASGVSPDCVTVDANGNAIVTGNGTQMSTPSLHGFLASYATNGSQNWNSTTVATPNDIRAEAVYQNTLYTASGGSTGFAKYDLSDGSLLFSEQVGSTAAAPLALAVDTNGNVYLSSVGPDTTFNPGPTLPGGSSYIVKLGSSGNFVSAWSYGGTNTLGLSVDSSGNIYSLGIFQGSANFDIGSSPLASLNTTNGVGLYMTKTTQDTGAIFGRVFNDLNGNGLFDPGSLESGIPGVTLYLDSNPSSNDVYVAGDPTAITDSQGYYQFTDVTPSLTYYVHQMAPNLAFGNFTVQAGTQVGATGTSSYTVSVAAGVGTVTGMPTGTTGLPATNLVFADNTPNQNYYYNSANVPLKLGNRSGQEIDSTLTINDAIPIFNLDVKISATVATATAPNVILILVAPDGTAQRVGIGDNPLTSFNYHNTRGIWTLRMYNDAPTVKTSTLNSWSLTFVGATSSVPPSPQIGSFTASPNPAKASSSVTLTVSGITDNSGGTITQIAIYFDHNNDGILEPGTDPLLGTAVLTNGVWTFTNGVVGAVVGTYSNGVWTFTNSNAFGLSGQLSGGSYRLFAQATDSLGNVSEPAALILPVSN